MTPGEHQMTADSGAGIEIVRMLAELDLTTSDGVAQGCAAIARLARLVLLDLTGLSFCAAAGSAPSSGSPTRPTRQGAVSPSSRRGRRSRKSCGSRQKRMFGSHGGDAVMKLVDRIWPTMPLCCSPAKAMTSCFPLALDLGGSWGCWIFRSTVAVQVRAFASPPSGPVGNVIRHLREIVMQARSAAMSASQGESACQHVIVPACHLPVRPPVTCGRDRLTPWTYQIPAGRSVLYNDCSTSLA